MLLFVSLKASLEMCSLLRVGPLSLFVSPAAGILLMSPSLPASAQTVLSSTVCSAALRKETFQGIYVDVK